MRVVIDIEANGLEPSKVSKIWVIVCKNIDTNEISIFRRPSDDHEVANLFKDYAKNITCLIGHNILQYDLPVLSSLLKIEFKTGTVFDTLVISKLSDYSRKGHSIEQYGLEFGLPKVEHTDWNKYSLEMEERCERDVSICERVYRRYAHIINANSWRDSVQAEQCFQLVVNNIHNNGFAFDSTRANKLLNKVNEELVKLDGVIHEQFPSRLRLVREIHPQITKHGTLHRKDFRWISDGDLSEYNGGAFCRCSWQQFNPASHKQVIEILTQAGWKPTDRTQTFIVKSRENHKRGLDITNGMRDNKQSEEKYSWKINETNLSTLPLTAPASAKSLARRILVESRRRTLTEWISLTQPDGRIHGKFYAIGAWTHRMAHQKPNTANIPNATDTQGKTRLYGAEMRALWCAPKNRLLVGVDAEGIQLRIFAHYINDKEFTDALVRGSKEEKTDPHSLNQRVLGNVCKSRAAAKRFIYALLLGAGLGKLAEVLGCSGGEAEEALKHLLIRYEGFARLKQYTIPVDAKRGWFSGLDGRKVKILGDSYSERKHLAMSGYLQNGEAVIMKHATLKWHERLEELGIEFKLVNFVHDEWQTECKNSMEVALTIAQEQADSLRWVGEKFKLKCPLAGSYYNEDLKDYTIGTNWKTTH